MDSGTQVIRDHNERQRELVAQDLRDLGDRLDPRWQVARAREGLAHTAHDKLDSFKEKLPMETPHNPAVRAALHHPLATAAFLWGGFHLARAMQGAHSNGHSNYASSSGGGLMNRMSDMRTGVQDGLSSAGSKVGDVTSSVGERASSAATSVQDSATNAASTVQDAAASAAGTVQETAASMAGSVQETAGAAVDRVRSVLPADMQEANNMAANGLPVVGAAAFAAGALIGYFAPNTSFEDEKLAPVRDDLMDTVTEKASEVKDAATSVATDAASRISDEVKEAASHVKEEATSAAKDAGEQLRDQVSSGSDDETSTQSEAGSTHTVGSATVSSV
jgi:gas vesicle protein